MVGDKNRSAERTRNVPLTLRSGSSGSGSLIRSAPVCREREENHVQQASPWIRIDPAVKSDTHVTS